MQEWSEPTSGTSEGLASEREGRDPGRCPVALERREFLRRLLLAGGSLSALASAEGAPEALAAPGAGASGLRMRRALWWQPLPNRRVRCELCPKHCQVGDRERGFCGVRENRDGVYYTLVYGAAAAANVDPIEKKPFYHFLPGTLAFSIATAGCNQNCKACQNWQLSQSRPEQVPSLYLPPQEVARQARRSGCHSIAYTYSEPVVFYEYMVDTAVAGRCQGVRSVVVSNGYIERQPLLALIPKVDAIKVDLKGFSEAVVRQYCNSTLAPVLETIKTVHAAGRWLELVVLVQPTINDSPAETERLCKWVRDNVGREVPLHFSRFYPQYQLKHLPPTPLATLQQCYKIAKQVGLHYVYLGNVPDSPTAHTYCPACGKVLVERVGYSVRAMRIKNGRCYNCGHRIPGVWG